MSEELTTRLRYELAEMAVKASVEMRLWNRFSNRVLTAADEIDHLRAELAAERDKVAGLNKICETNERILSEALSYCGKLEAELVAERERANDAEEALTIAYMQGAADMRAERDAALANVAKLREALVPFARIKPSSLYEDSENEGYIVMLPDQLAMKKFDFRRADIIKAHSVLEETKGDGDE